MGKRANNQMAAKSVAKKAKADPTLTSIAEVIMEAEDLPNRCRTMLVEMLPFALNAPAEERHEIQRAASDMVEQTLKAKKAMMENAVVVEAAKLVSLKDSHLALTNAVDEAVGDLAAQKDVVQNAKSALADATIAANASRDAVSNLRSEQTSADAKLECAREEKTALESAFENHFKPMKEDAAGPHFQELEPLLKKLVMEESLLIALPSTCAKSKEHRGTFDNVVLEELEKAICLKLSALGETVEAEAPASAERETAVQVAEKDREAKKETQMQAVSAFENAQKEQSDRESALGQKRLAADELQPEIDLVTGLADKAKEALDLFEAGPLAGFKSYGVTPASAEAAPLGA